MYEEAILKRGSVSNRGSLLRCATLALLLCLSGSGAVAQEARQPNAGALRAQDSSGKLVGECPLKHTSVKAEVSGFISRVTVTQDFENTFTEKIEAVYVFPLPQAAAVDDLTMQIGERIIKGKIMRREEAQAAYAAAKQLGQTAALLDQHRPNIFSQAVANIMPGQQIRVVISYVETLKYEDGSYEWSFPMVVGPRYNPADISQAAAPQQAPISDRTGHDISLELTLDAGVPIEALHSETHETEVDRPDGRRAIVRLKGQDTIPNRDFVIKYQTAGPAINDAVLAHRSERGGFFTLILQPPQRVSAADVTPKELVFVVDTSGSMYGFPIEKAKETVDLALDTLHQYDMFNIITFAGDTNLLFPEPQFATPENIRTAKKFLSSSRSGGGTEMMKAITAALEPTDSQQHMRITCFLTDGQVGNDMAIIAAVKKYKKARVFAMGFGSAPNRYLLDNMAQHGRGEVDYVTGAGDTVAVARRFNERVRNPYLTDISIEWPANLAIADVYPKQIPDLFSAKPLVVAGRYLHGGNGSIILRGKIAGQDFVREIPVVLPETESSHDVLATLWARRKIDDIMAGDLAGIQSGFPKPEVRGEIEQLGLKFKLMTQFTSFVAVDEASATGAEPPILVQVPQYVTAMSGATLNASVMMTASVVQVMNNSSTITTQTNQVSDLPLQGRSFVNLLTLAPGTVPGSTRLFSEPSVATTGQRPQANTFTVDGLSANFGITPGGQSPGASAAGSTLALTASGGANGVAAVDSVQEMSIKTSYAGAEYGRVPGAQVNVVTRAGTNDYRGSLFHFLGNDVTDANDWFANSRGLNKPTRRLNNFGGTFGGPIMRDQLFFFGSYEGLRLRHPMTGITDVPSLSSRAAAVSEVRPLLDAFPLPTGPARPDGFAEFAATFANSAQHDVGSLRVDWSRASTTLSGRYSFADSSADARGAGGFSLNTINRIRSRAETTTGMITWTVSPTVVVDVRANYSRLRVASSHTLDSFGGGVVPSNLVGGDGESFNFDLNARSANLMISSEVANIQRQFDSVGTLNIVSGNHTLKFGADYRRTSPLLNFRARETNFLFDGVNQAITGVPARLSVFNREPAQSPDFNNFSLFAHDEWRTTSRLTLNYGLRWELNPAPSNDGTPPLAVDQIVDPTRITAAAPGTALWQTTYLNLAPRVGVSYQLLGNNDPQLILRGGFAVLYDMGQHHAGDAFADSIPFVSGGSVAPAIVFDPKLKLPYTLQWNVGLERSLGSRQSIFAAYVGTAGRRLLHTQTLFDQNAAFPFLRLTSNAGRSDYRALQVQFNRGLSDGLTSSISYTWARSLDNVSDDSARHVLMSSANPALDRGPSDFDVKHQLNGYVDYQVPALFSKGVGNKVFRNWTVSSIANLRSARPVNVVYVFPTPFGVGYFRPNVVAGEPLYLFDPTLAGGKAINPAAFVEPSMLEQGNLGRNSLRGFPLHQIDLALRRAFNFSEQLSLQFRVDVFNTFNHPNFADPVGRDRVVGSVFSGGSFTPNSTFGRSSSLLGQSLSESGFGSFYSSGGPRTLRFSLKLIF